MLTTALLVFRHVCVAIANLHTHYYCFPFVLFSCIGSSVLEPPSTLKSRMTYPQRTITVRRFQGEFPFVLIGRTHYGQKLHCPKVEGVYILSLTRVSTCGAQKRSVVSILSNEMIGITVPNCSPRYTRMFREGREPVGRKQPLHAKLVIPLV